MSSKFVATKRPVNGNVAPDDFLQTLIKVAKRLLAVEPSVFEVNDNYDIYSSVLTQLGPYSGLHNRAAVMLEALRCLASRESSYNWLAGKDPGANNDLPWTTEAGIFQCSSNSMYFSAECQELFFKKTGHKYSNSAVVGKAFQYITKSDHEFCVEYCIKLLRATVEHHGPIKHHVIHPDLSRSAVAEFESYLDPAPQARITPIELARKEIGVHEIEPGSNPRILEYHSHSHGKFKDDDISWCASFCNFILDKANYDRPRGDLDALAASYRDYGSGLSGPEEGCILVFKLASGHYHVAFCSDFNDEQVLALGGNQTDSKSGGAVNEKWHDRKYVVAYRKPTRLS